MTSTLRRLIGLSVGLLPLVLVGLSFVTERRLELPFQSMVGIGLVVQGSFVGLLNAYLSWLRPWLHARGRGRLEPLRHFSGVPLLGSAAYVGLWLVPASLTLSSFASALLLLDTGGLPWFVYAVWKDRAFWDAER